MDTATVCGPIKLNRSVSPPAVRAQGPVFADPASATLLKLLARVAPGDLPLMISGEVGTGKEEVARYVHQLSGRSGAFVKVDCESEDIEVAHCLDAARGGTLFIEEPAALPAALQGQILALLQEQESLRAALGPATGGGISQDARLIAGTSVDMNDVVNAGHFRPDLFYRLNAAQIRLLPLRQRPGDIAPLAQHFLHLFATQLRISSARLLPEAVLVLRQYSWPGHVSELRHVIHSALLSAPGGVIRAEHLQLHGLTRGRAVGTDVAEGEGSDTSASGNVLVDWLSQLFRQSHAHLFNELESLIVAEALRFTRGNQVRSAALLGISRNVLRTLIRKHNLPIGRGK